MVVLELIRQGQPVLWLILLCGFVAFVSFIERALHLHRARIRSEDFLSGIMNILRRGNVKEALAICDETPGPVAYVVKTAILHRGDIRDDLDAAVHDASLVEISRMERRIAVIATVAQIAPLLGLLGTVLGLLETFLGMQTQAPFIQMANISGGVMRSLVTAAAGLTVAIPCYAAFNLLASKIGRIVLDMERAGSEIRAFLASLPPEAKKGDA